MSEGTSEVIIENKKIYPGIKNAIFLCLIFFGLEIGIGIILWIIIYISGIDRESILYQTVTILMNILTTGLVIFIGYKKSHKKFDEVFVFNDVSSNLWIAITVFMCGFIILASEISNVLIYFLPIKGFNSGPSVHTFQPLWFDVLGIVLISIGIILFFREIEES